MTVIAELQTVLTADIGSMMAGLSAADSGLSTLAANAQAAVDKVLGSLRGLAVPPIELPLTLLPELLDVRAFVLQATTQVGTIGVDVPVELRLSADGGAIRAQFQHLLEAAAAARFKVAMVADVTVSAGAISVDRLRAAVAAAIESGSGSGGRGRLEAAGIKQAAKGAYVQSGGLLEVHPGERVLNAQQTAALGGAYDHPGLRQMVAALATGMTGGDSWQGVQYVPGLPRFAGGGYTGGYEGLAYLHPRETIRNEEQERALQVGRGGGNTYQIYGQSPYDLARMIDQARSEMGK